MESTRPMPPWALPDHYVQTYLEKTITARIGFVNAPPPGELDVEYAREYLYFVPSTQWSNAGGQ